MESKIINSNIIAFAGLANEYCTALENAASMTRKELINSMIHLLPRIYIVATDLSVNILNEEDAAVNDVLDEESYEDVRRTLATVFGSDDVYLEVFEEDMKFSDTPVSASIAEGLADVYQVLYNFIATIRDATDETIALAVVAVREDFRDYWSQPLLNTLRAINSLARQDSSCPED